MLFYCTQQNLKKQANQPQLLDLIVKNVNDDDNEKDKNKNKNNDVSKSAEREKEKVLPETSLLRKTKEKLVGPRGLEPRTNGL